MIRLEQDGALWRVTIDRPDKANSLTPGMLGEIAEIAEAAKGVAQVFVLTGAGKVFSAGADIEAARAGLATDPVWERLSGAIAALPCLTIAALNGTAAGGSLGMVLACDLRLAVPQAKFFYPVMRLGFLPRPGDPERLTALVGPSRAKMILMAGQKIAADEALACGLVDRLVPAEDLLAVAEAMATDALGASREHVVAIKSLIR